MTVTAARVALSPEAGTEAEADSNPGWKQGQGLCYWNS